MFKHACIAILTLGTLLGAPATAAPQPEVQEAVDAALELAQDRSLTSDWRNRLIAEAAHRIKRLGPQAIPLLSVELKRANQDSFFFCAYALGLIGTQAAQDALYAAIDAAEAQAGDWPSLRKGWACWALGLMGVEEAIERANDGRHRSGKHSIHDRFSVLDTIAIQTGERGTRVLIEQLEKFGEQQPTGYRERISILRALGWSRSETALDILREQAFDGHPALRLQATESIAASDAPAARAILVSLLDESDVAIRRSAAAGLAESHASDAASQVETRIEGERDSRVRSSFYRTLAEQRGVAATQTLIDAWGRPDPLDRTGLISVFDRIDPQRSIPLLIQALADTNIQVSVAAANALGRVDGDEARAALLAAIDRPAWNLVHAAVNNLVRLTHPDAAARIARRLIEVELPGVVTDARRFVQIQALAEALVALRAAPRLDEIRSAAARQTDPTLTTVLDRIVNQLATIRKCGSRLRCWNRLLDAADPEIRRLAYGALGNYGSDRQARRLAARFPRADPADRIAILRALGNLDSPAARQLLERVLISPAFDRPEHRPLRDIAAWSARRIAGPEMLAALCTAVERRDGRDTRPLVYWALLAGQDALAGLDRYRALRLRHVSWQRGRELVQLDRLRRKIARGATLGEFDHPPERLRF